MSSWMAGSLSQAKPASAGRSWGKRVAGYEKQFADCLRIYELQHDRLDMAYLDAWAARLNITDVLARIRQLACPVR